MPDAKYAELEHAAINRYRPVPAGVLAYAVVAGNGTRKLFTGTKDECQIVARKLTEAFLDGAHMAISARTPHVAETPEQEQDESDVSLGVTGAPRPAATPVKGLPYEPTSDMLIAARENDPAMPIETIRAIWWAMWRTAPRPAAQQGEPFGYFRAEPFGWTDCAEGDEGAVALYEKAGAADATLHKIIAGVEAALDAAGAPAGTLVERIGALEAVGYRNGYLQRDAEVMGALV